jgi:hypothetical protein
MLEVNSRLDKGSRFVGASVSDSLSHTLDEFWVVNVWVVESGDAAHVKRER